MIPDIDYNDKDLMRFIGNQEAQSIQSTMFFREEMEERLKLGWQLRGDVLPWSKTHDLIRFGEGQVSVWAGINGHKKSMLSGMVMMWFAQQTTVGVASFEMPVIDTMERMIAQAAGCMPSPSFGQQWLQWGHNKLYFYDQLDTVPTERVLGVIYYMAHECGCKHVMIDSLTKCGLRSGDRDSEKKFLDTIAAAAKALSIHIHVIAHVRKPPQGGDEHIPGRFDVRGAGEITDLVDNVLIVWADKKKDRLNNKKNAGVDLTEPEQEYCEGRPDQRLIVAKQRYGRWEDQIGLWFDSESMQFSGDSSGLALPFNLNQAKVQNYG